MKKITFLWMMLLMFSFAGFSQEGILVVQKPYVVLMDAETGNIIDNQFIDLNPLTTQTPKGVTQVGQQIWVTDQLADVIYRFDLEGNHLGNITGNMDNIRGLRIVNNEVWVTNAGASGGAPGNAIVRFDMEGNHLGFFPTDNRSPFDVIDAGNGEVFISYSSGGSPIERRDYDGNFIDFLVSPNQLNFVQQMDITAANKLLVGTFSSPAGVYVFDLPSGSQLNYWSNNGVRGVMETGDGSILWTSSSGIHRLNPATGTSTTLSSTNAQFFGRLNADGGCTTPTLTVETPDPVCEGSSATLVASSNGDEINWYDSATSTTPVFTGTEFTTTELTETTSYWVQAVSYGTGGAGEVITGGARVAPTNNSTATVVAGTSPWGLSFDVHESFTINSVDVYLASSSPGTLEMQLLDVNWELIESATISTPAGSPSNPVQYQVDLDFSVEAGNTYRLVAASSPEMIREFSSGHPGFPYPIGTAGTVTGGTINRSHSNNNVYYFFYNWTVTVGDVEICTSAKEEVVVNVLPSPDAPTGDEEQFFDEGDTLADLDVTADGTLTWYADSGRTTTLPSSTPLVDGTTYYVSQTMEGCESELLAITVHLRLGINDAAQDLIKVYPNPVNDVLNIVSGKSIDKIEVFDITGRKIEEVRNISSTVDFGKYSAGTYVLKISVGEGVRTVKIIKR